MRYCVSHVSCKHNQLIKYIGSFITLGSDRFECIKQHRPFTYLQAGTQRTPLTYLNVSANVSTNGTVLDKYNT